MERNRRRLEEHQDIIRLRQAIVEAPFSWLKHHSLIGGFITKGLKMVDAEFSLAQLAYNMTRIANIKAHEGNGRKSTYFFHINCPVVYIDQSKAFAA